MSTIACARCGEQTPEAFAYYDEEGQICSNCHDQADLHSGFRSGYQNYAFAALGLAALSLFVNPCFLFSITAIGSAMSAFTYPSRLGEDREAVAGMGHVPLIASLAMLIAIVGPVLRVFLRIAATM